ncbi:hypothetical protein ASG40_17715 [Methylobacterium sp. Leaf399]|uniref:recombinase family protein n=1 Tax=Methylobacterium sp. Leaf399 TaxID=1736364 RepID=UPI0007000894|nr:recombinase family protein [Methylobacterium sp. Leaf399]KQT17219.1 hypothetical protein ASG40_17715 [Methylobacterium sp. Leaf399]
MTGRGASTSRSIAAPVARPLRCAIYTRVSTEHGLEQEFNSLHNQREAAEAYIKSQAHEGWRCLPAPYDDGGFSGGSLERPALQRLLAEIALKRIDVVVVYKVDRLTRSLSDFARLVELFDAHGVSFVSVTQAFNTTTSMGRLTLNVLLSFAQFEREVTGERIRDKIAASKRKGLWMGGVVPLGYRVEARALHVVEEHAVLIRSIFARYLELGAVTRLQAELDEAGITVPERIDGKGNRLGGKPFSRGHLYQILASPLYIGRLTHRGRVFEGQHQPIVEAAIFEVVQAKLTANHHGKASHRLPSEHLLVGRIHTAEGHALTPSHTVKGTRRYRYYVSQAVLKGKEAARHSDANPIRRLSAPDIEAAVVQSLRSQFPRAGDLSDAEVIARGLAQVVVHPDALHLELTGEERSVVQVRWSPNRSQRHREIIVPPGSDRLGLRPMKVEDRARILKAVATARSWIDDLLAARIADTDAIAMREGCSERSVRMTLSLAQLSPRIVQALVEGRLPRGIGIKSLAELPLSWAEQEHAIGF